MNESEKLLNLESLRGLAAVSVAFFHFDSGSHFNNVFVTHAWLMVDFFFVLSGFVIALNYQNRIKSIHDLLVFQKKRLLRLYPLHLIMLMVFFGIEVVKYIAEIKFNLIANNRAFSVNDLGAFFANVTLLHNWTMTGLTFNYPSWSISAEFYTYALFGVIALLTIKSIRSFYIASVILVLLTGMALYSRGMEASITGPWRCIHSFFIGAITYGIYQRFNLRDRLRSSFTSLIMLSICIWLVILLGGQKTGLVITIPFIFAAAVLSLVATKTTSRINKVLSNSWLVYLGTISYGIYMIHAAVWWLYMQLMRFMFDFTTIVDIAGNRKVIIDNVFLADAISLSGIVLIIILAHFSYVFIETKFNKKRGKLK